MTVTWWPKSTFPAMSLCDANDAIFDLRSVTLNNAAAGNQLFEGLNNLTLHVSFTASAPHFEKLCFGGQDLFISQNAFYQFENGQV